MAESYIICGKKRKESEVNDTAATEIASVSISDSFVHSVNCLKDKVNMINMTLGSENQIYGKDSKQKTNDGPADGRTSGTEENGTILSGKKRIF